MKVLVTGGTGFIGSAIVRHLLDDGYDVRVLARYKRNRFLLDGLKVEIVDGNLTSVKAVEAAVKGCSVVIDVASVYAFYPFWEKEARAMYRINIEGTKNILKACLDNNVTRYIHTSTIATIGKNHAGSPSNERTPFDLNRPSHYARSKYLAEKEVLSYVEKGLHAVILNPAIVIGARDHKPTPSGEIITKFLNKSYPGYFETTWSVADVDDVARAHIAAINKGRVGERYILCNKKHHTMKEFFSQLEEVSDVKAPIVKIPYFLLFLFVHIEEFLSYKLFKKKPLLPTEGVKFSKSSNIYDNAKAVDELGYSETPFKETLKKTVNWYRENRYVAPRGLFRIKSNGLRITQKLMHFIKIDRYSDRLSWDICIFYIMILCLNCARKIGISPSADGWRKITQVYLHTEESKFILASFRLNFKSNLIQDSKLTFNEAKSHCVHRLVQFLKNEPLVHCELKYRRFSVHSKGKSFVDIVEANFDISGYLTQIKPHLDDSKGVFEVFDTSLMKTINSVIVETYNLTKDFTDIKRPKLLKDELEMWIVNKSQLSNQKLINLTRMYIDRILSATFIHFEKMFSANDGFAKSRTQVPSFIKRKHPGFGLLNVACRFDFDLNEADLWVQSHHVPIDGVPLQELLTKLKKSWGQCDVFRFPVSTSKNNNDTEIQRCSNHAGEKSVSLVNEIIDFRPFLKYRKKFIAQYGKKMNCNITFAALFIWELTHHSLFEDLKFTIPVDLAETKHEERSLGFVFIRPSTYFDRSKADRGFLNFQKNFDNQLRRTLKRKGNGYQLLKSYALTPPFMYRLSRKSLPNAVKEFGGTMGLSIIKDAELFVAPYSDVQVDGFIAISNFYKKAEDGSVVCNVSIKGPEEKVLKYMNVIKAVASLGDTQ